MARYTEVTYPKLKDKWVRILKQELKRSRTDSKATLKDIGVVFDDYIAKTDYATTKQTKLYINQGGEYSSLLEMLNYLDELGKFKEVYEVQRSKSISTVYAIYSQGSRTFNNKLILFSNEKDGLECFSRLFTLGHQKNGLLYDTNADYKKKYNAEINLACKKAIHTIENLDKDTIQGEDVNFLYENKKITILNPLKIII